MSETPSDLWSGHPREAPSPKPLTWTERDLLKVYLRFRHTKPTAGWMLSRAILYVVVLGPLTAVLGALIALAIVIFTLPTTEAELASLLATGATAALAICLGMTFGFVVRDHIDLRHTVAGWGALVQVLNYAEVERLLNVSKPADPPTPSEDASK